MRRFARYVILILGIPACDSPTEMVVPEGPKQLPTLAAARSLVDPGTLIPEPPNGVCWRVGGGTICHTQLSFPSVNEPIGLELACDTVYQTGSDVRLGIRWYDEENKLVRRSYTLTADAAWSLSPAGAGPTVDVTIRENWFSLFAVPGDLASEFGGRTAGNGVRIQSPGFGVIGHVAGLDDSRGTHIGIFLIPEDPTIGAKLCEALT